VTVVSDDVAKYLLFEDRLTTPRLKLTSLTPALPQIPCTTFPLQEMKLQLLCFVRARCRDKCPLSDSWK